MRAKYIALGGVLSAVSMLTAMKTTDHLVPGEPVLAPIADTRFCMRYPNDCKKTAGKDKTDAVKSVILTPEHRGELDEINASVNRSIVPQVQAENAVNDNWLIAPAAGDCNDYAVTKRHELLAKGWPSGALLLVEVKLPSGEHHLVLIARTNEGDLVLDNLKSTVRTVAEASLNYKWVRMESANEPKFWNKVQMPT
jgi:predicted transglutaminase-like cysteine proteinase